MLFFISVIFLQVFFVPAVFQTDFQSRNDHHGKGENQSCTDVTPPIFQESINCGLLISAILAEGCQDTMLKKGNYCAKSCPNIPCDDPLSDALYEAQQNSIYTNAFGFDSPALWLLDFDASDKDYIYLNDVNQDGLDDIVAFGERGVYVSLSTGKSFQKPEIWIRDFGSGERTGGWQQSVHPRVLADVNGDGLDDIVGFYKDGTYVAINNETHFRTKQLWYKNYGIANGWSTQEVYPRFMVDMNKDGKKDVVGFGGSGLFVSMANKTSFDAPKAWTKSFGHNQYVKSSNPVFLSDVNGDGVPDIIGFGKNGVELALATNQQTFNTKFVALKAFSNVDGWRTDRHVRFVEDIDGDGMSDIIGMGDGGVYIARSYGEGFEAPQLVVGGEFGYYAGHWDVKKNPRMLVDVNGDGLLDIVGFKNEGTIVSFNMGMGDFEEPISVIDWFGADMAAGGWTDVYPRFMSDVSGDGRVDIVGFAVEGVYVSTAWTQ